MRARVGSNRGQTIWEHSGGRVQQCLLLCCLLRWHGAGVCARVRCGARLVGRLVVVRWSVGFSLGSSLVSGANGLGLVKSRRTCPSRWVEATLRACVALGRGSTHSWRYPRFARDSGRLAGYQP